MFFFAETNAVLASQPGDIPDDVYSHGTSGNDFTKDNQQPCHTQRYKQSHGSDGTLEKQVGTQTDAVPVTALSISEDMSGNIPCFDDADTTEDTLSSDDMFDDNSSDNSTSEELPRGGTLEGRYPGKCTEFKYGRQFRTTAIM